MADPQLLGEPAPPPPPGPKPRRSSDRGTVARTGSRAAGTAILMYPAGSRDRARLPLSLPDGALPVSDRRRHPQVPVANGTGRGARPARDRFVPVRVRPERRSARLPGIAERVARGDGIVPVSDRVRASDRDQHRHRPWCGGVRGARPARTTVGLPDLRRGGGHVHRRRADRPRSPGQPDGRPSRHGCRRAAGLGGGRHRRNRRVHPAAGRVDRLSLEPDRRVPERSWSCSHWRCSPIPCEACETTEPRCWARPRDAWVSCSAVERCSAGSGSRWDRRCPTACRRTLSPPSSSGSSRPSCRSTSRRSSSPPARPCGRCLHARRIKGGDGGCCSPASGPRWESSRSGWIRSCTSASPPTDSSDSRSGSRSSSARRSPESRAR